MKRAVFLSFLLAVSPLKAAETNKKSATPLIIALTTGITAVYLNRLGKAESIDSTSLHDEAARLNQLGMAQDSNAVFNHAHNIERRASQIRQLAGIFAGVSILTASMGFYLAAKGDVVTLNGQVRF